MSGTVFSRVLVLLTGLPGAGKSTFLKELKVLLAKDDAFTVKTFTLDEFLYSDEQGFTPAAWRQASHSLFAACEAAIGSDGERTCYIFVEDNMHYQSMRERYWRLCQRHVGKEEGEGVAMVEVRLALPLDVCLTRNEQRRGTREYVPGHVIQSMNELFEPCLRKAPTCDGDDAHERISPRHLWWIEDRTTKPWLLLLTPPPGHLTDCAAASPSVLASDFLALLFSLRSTQRLLREQLSLSKRKCAERQPPPHRADTATFTSASHRLDIALRTMVRFYFQSLEEEEGGTATQLRKLQKPVQQLKKAALSAFKKHGRNAPSADSEEDVVESALAEAIATFQSQLAAL